LKPSKALVPSQLLDPVIEYFRPQRVILFGSTARGEAGPDSDIDLLVIVDDDTPPEKLTWKARHQARGAYPHAADVFPMRAESFEQYRDVVGTLAAEAALDGVVVYGPAEGPRPMKQVEPRVRWRAVERWLAVAEQDRAAVAACLAAATPLYGIAAFHCQQAVEKLLKGFLTLAGKRSRKTHSLADLGGMAVPDFSDIADLVEQAENWGSWAFDFRYPSEPGNAKPEPNDGELRQALAVIDALAARLRAAQPE
jgi:uncharacterized protein